jgi:hypothetical protein
MTDIFTFMVNPHIANVAHSHGISVSQRVIVDVLQLVDIVWPLLLITIPVEDANEEIVRQVLQHFIKVSTIWLHSVLVIWWVNYN